MKTKTKTKNQYNNNRTRREPNLLTRIIQLTSQQPTTIILKLKPDKYYKKSFDQLGIFPTTNLLA